MPYTIALILGVMWLLGMVTGYPPEYFTHILLVIAVVMVLVNLILPKKTQHARSQYFGNQCDVDQKFRGRDSARDYARDQDATERQKRMDQGAAFPRRE
jgi:hypothetical protein